VVQALPHSAECGCTYITVQSIAAASSTDSRSTVPATLPQFRTHSLSRVTVTGPAMHMSSYLCKNCRRLRQAQHGLVGHDSVRKCRRAVRHQLDLPVSSMGLCRHELLHLPPAHHLRPARDSFQQSSNDPRSELVVLEQSTLWSISEEAWRS